MELDKKYEEYDKFITELMYEMKENFSLEDMVLTNMKANSTCDKLFYTIMDMMSSLFGFKVYSNIGWFERRRFKKAGKNIEYPKQMGKKNYLTINEAERFQVLADACKKNGHTLSIIEEVYQEYYK